MPDRTLTDRAHELVDYYRILARNLEQEDAARLSSALGHMLSEVERAKRVQSDSSARLAEDALTEASRVLHSMHHEV